MIHDVYDGMDGMDGVGRWFLFLLPIPPFSFLLDIPGYPVAIGLTCDDNKRSR